jgi:hypothetical protein
LAINLIKSKHEETLVVYWTTFSNSECVIFELVDRLDLM